MQEIDSGELLDFDSKFEGGNLDKVVIISPQEYDLYMRVDSNTYGHHQWFFYKIKTKGKVGKVKFNIVNFTKKRSLYENGMRICVCSQADREAEMRQL
jgi:hypothetical protein